MPCRNYIQIYTRLPWLCRYIFLDTPGHLSYDIFRQVAIPAKVVGEYGENGVLYRMVDIRSRKKYEAKFLQCFEKLETKILLYGYADYKEYCAKFVAMEEEARQNEEEQLLFRKKEKIT